ncbi:Serine/threonine-protein phosphatase 7 long form-like protein [Hordeum vulgare]|nr:Serine/threonine-protein phosphatase 7 long form-like protein [Hordeum vulgare]
MAGCGTGCRRRHDAVSAAARKAGRSPDPGRRTCMVLRRRSPTDLRPAGGRRREDDTLNADLMGGSPLAPVAWMFRPDQYPGLDDYYEKKHRAVLVERGEVPPLLRLRGHNPNETLVYDPRYEPYFKRMDLLQFVLNFKGTPPWLNTTALTALTDRWRPETHSFHLPLGEMSITLEDIAMISGLPIEGRALTGKVGAVGWRQRVAALVGVEPEPWTDETRKDPRPSSVLFSWIQRHFHRCPRDASPLVVDRFARAYLWNLLIQVVFPDGTGNTASWMFLNPLRDWGVKWSWGSATLAFLYRQDTELWRCINESNVVLARAPCPQTDGLVRTTLQKVANRCSTLAALLSCHGVSSTDVRARAQYTMDVQSSARPSASRPRASSARPSLSRAHVSSSRAHEEEIEEEDESDNEAADPDFIEFGASQMNDAP